MMEPHRNEGVITNPTNEFLVEGATGFLDVFNAMAEFRRNVQSFCRTCLEQKLSGINDALGIQLMMENSEPSGIPESLDDAIAKGQWATIGWKFKLPNRIGYLDLYLWWDQTHLPDCVAAVVAFRFREKMEGLRVFESVLQPVGFQSDDKAWEVFLMRELRPKQMSSLNTELDILLTDAIKKCKSASKLHGLLSRVKKTKLSKLPQE